MIEPTVDPLAGTGDRHEELVPRFHRVLVESIRDRSPSYLSDRFTVAEIYQFLVPYRTHRDRLGVSMSGDYEDTLLRLLAGEGDLVVLESDSARRRIREELESRNPNTGIYREFAAAEVRLSSGGVPLAPEVHEPSEGRDMKPKEEGPNAAVASGGMGPLSGEPNAQASASNCPECARALPDRESVRFCPHCGANVLEAPCPNCGKALDRQWSFCIACGVPARGQPGS